MTSVVGSQANSLPTNNKYGSKVWILQGIGATQKVDYKMQVRP